MINTRHLRRVPIAAPFEKGGNPAKFQTETHPMKKLPLGFWVKLCTLSYDLLGMGDLHWASSKIESGGARNFKAFLPMLNPASSG